MQLPSDTATINIDELVSLCKESGYPQSKLKDILGYGFVVVDLCSTRLNISCIYHGALCRPRWA